MSSSPITSHYDLRSRKKSPDGKHISEKEATQSFPSSQSESSGMEDITTDDEEQHVKGQGNKSLDMSADETDAGITHTSDEKVAVTNNRKESHADEIGAGVKSETKETNEKGKNTAARKEGDSGFSFHLDKSIKTYKNICISCLQQSFILLLISFLVMKFVLRMDVLRSLHDKNENGIIIERPVAYRLGNLTTTLEHIKEKYATLDDSFWDIIVGSSWGHMQGDGTFKQPVVLLLVGQPKSTNLDVVANEVAKLYSNVFTLGDDSTIHIDGGGQAMKKADQAKLDMDNLLKNGFHNGKKVVLVTKFDKLPPCSIMLFHSYCDNDYAPHKDTVIIFTVELETTVSDAALGIEELVQDYLGALWAQCPEELLQDKIMAMHSRVSNNIAFVK